jgi:hypothetical protein
MIKRPNMTNPIPARLARFALATALAGLAIGLTASDATAQSATQSTATNTSQPSDADVLLNLFQKRGLISDQDVQDAHAALASRTNASVAASPPVPASPWKISDTIKSIQLFGDMRFRYEYRGVENIPGASPGTFDRERLRYALRIGLRGEIVDNFNYGIRLETANNPRSPWSTFGNNSTAGSVTPSDKNASGIYIGQLFLNWHPADWYEMTVGRMPMPLYTTPMVWDSDINPEGLFEKFKYSVKSVDLFADFGQFVYQDPSSGNEAFSSDTFMLAWQLGANVKFDTNLSFKIAPVFYNYTGVGTTGNGLNLPFVGQGNAAGVNVGVPGATAPNLAAFNQNGINNLLILEIPAEFNFKIARSPMGPLQTRVFGDFAYNFSANDRANAAYNANPAAFPGLTGGETGQNKAYQVGIGIGSAVGLYGPTQGLVYGSYSKKHAWEARTYYQHIEQYALDVNLIDSDFFEGRGNLQGIYTAFAYGITDAMIGTVRYGYASRIRNDLGTGGNNLDIPGINPINDYNIVQLDLTWRF